MSDTPTPPEILSEEMIETLETRSPRELEAITRYVDALAQYRRQSATANESGTDATTDTDEREERAEDAVERRDGAPDEAPEGVPSKATITIKEINDNRYYYWQWREGDEIKSQYEGPVTPGE